jgi:hypothetical protein
VRQLVVDRELVFTHLRQRRSDCVPQFLPANTGNANPLERGLALLLQRGGQIERLPGP